MNLVQDLARQIKASLPFAVLNEDPRNMFEKLVTYKSLSDIPSNIHIFNTTGNSTSDFIVKRENAPGGIGFAHPTLDIRAGKDVGEYNTLAFNTYAGGPLAKISTEVVAAGVYPNSIGKLHFAIQNGAGQQTMLTMSENSTSEFFGKVGIGVSPSYKLHVVNEGLGLRVENTNTSFVGNAWQFLAYDAATVDADASTYALAVFQTARPITSTGNIIRVVNTNLGEVFVVKDNGNVGIGTDSPSTKIHVSGASTASALRLDETTSSANSYLGYIDTSGNFGIDVNGGGYLRFATAGTQRVTLDTSGGLTLQTDQGAETGLAIYNTNSTASAKASLKVGYDGANHLWIYRNGNDASIFYDSTQAASDHQFLISGKEALRITQSNGSGGLTLKSNAGQTLVHMGPEGSGGTEEYGFITGYKNGTQTWALGVNTGPSYINTGQNFGIGTNSPNYLLSVRTSTDHQFYVRDSSTDAGNEIQIQAGNDADNALQNMKFAADRYYFEQGSVGIGTDSPTAPLEVYGSATTSQNAAIVIDAPSGNNYEGIQYRVSGVDYGYTAQEATGRMYHGAALEHIFRTGTGAGSIVGGTDAMVIDSSQRVGINTSSPTSSLTVAGPNTAVNMGGNNALTIMDGDADDEFVTMKFQTGAGGSLAAIGAKAVTTGAYPNSVGELHFAIQNASQRYTAMVIDEDRNVGIGTTSPVSRLHVNSEASFGADGDNRGIIGYSGSFYIGTRQSATNYFNTLNVTTGRVGIGETSPSYSLQVNSPTSTDANYIVAGDTTFVAALGSQDSPGVGQEAFVGTLSNHDFKLKTNSTERMRITSAGLVGIGTSNPQGKLDVDGDLRVTHWIVANSVWEMISLGTDRSIDDYGGLYKDYWRINVVTPGTTTTGESDDHRFGDLRFSGVTGNNSTYEDRMTIRYNGNVGIGTDVPDTKLHISGSGNVAGKVVSTDAAAVWAADSISTEASILSFTTAGAAAWKIQKAATTGNLEIRNSTDATKFTMVDNGNVGLGIVPNPGWSSTYAVLQIGQDVALWGAPSSAAAALSSNLYYDGGAYRYLNSSRAASQIYMSGGQFGIQSAVSGTAGQPAGLSARLHMTNDGKFFINSGSLATTDSTANLNIATGGSAGGLKLIGGFTPGDGNDLGAITFAGNDSANNNSVGEASITAKATGAHSGSTAPTALLFSTKPASLGPGSSPVERMRIDSVGNVSVNDAYNTAFMNTATAGRYIGVASNNSDALFIAHSSGQGVGYFGYDYSADRLIIATDNGAGGNSIQFSVNAGATSTGAFDNLAAATAAMKIDSSGAVLINKTTTTGLPGILTDGTVEVNQITARNAFIVTEMASGNVAFATSSSATHQYYAGHFNQYNGSTYTNVGSISVGTTSTGYNTASDYRLKENVVGITDGITRIKSLKPSRFNFIVESDRTVDGFVAHEVSDIVPEAVTGAKDAVDEEGNPEYQGIDQSKLVPLLTAALQEAIEKIETLETKVAALEENSK